MHMNEINATAKQIVDALNELGDFSAEDYELIEHMANELCPAGTDDTDKRRVRVRVRTMLEPDQED